MSKQNFNSHHQSKSSSETCPPLPRSTESEKSFLGATLLGSAGTSEHLDRLDPSEFFLPFHQVILRHLKQLRKLGMPTNDLAILHDAIECSNELDAAGGTPYIASLADGLPKVCNVADYVKAIKETARHRAMIVTSELNTKKLLAAKNGDAPRIMREVADSFGPHKEWDGQSEDWRGLFDTFEEFENAPAMSFSIEGFLQNEAITAIAALSGHGKTWIALSIARGLLFAPGVLWDLFKIPKRVEKVVYLIPESARAPIKSRLQVMDLYDEIRTGRLLIRTLSKGPAPELDDVRLLRAVKGATVILDTGVRFMHCVDESSAGEVAEGLSNDMLGLLRAEASSVIPLFHSPKSFSKESSMTLEGMIRGSSELGAVLATGWGVRQIDAAQNIIHIENIKPRDFQPCGPFQIIGRPFIDQDKDFHLLKHP